MNKFCSALLLPLLVAAACSSNDGAKPSVIQPGSGGASNGGGTTVTTATTGPLPSSGAATTSPSTGGFMPTSTTGQATTGVNPEEVCAGVKLEPQTIEVEVPKEVVTVIETEVPAPIAIYVVLDNSLSMAPSGGFPGGDPGAGGAGNEPSRWKDAVDALTGFVEDPASEGVEVGIQYFNPPGPNGDANLCDGTFQGTPAVDVGPLPENADAIVASLESTGPEDYTPTVGAMMGGVSFCTTFRSENPDYQCVVVMVTDGQPNDCGLSASCGMGGSMDCVDPLAAETLTPIAADGLAAGVNTFTVGMDGVTDEGFALLDAIAAAGGTDCTPAAAGDEACDVSETGSAGLLAAFETIRDTVVVTETVTETITEIVTEVVALPCEWELPDAPDGETLDPNLVNVILNIDGMAGDPIGRVQSEGECAAVTAGWHYDDPENPTTISVCPQTCEMVKAGNVGVQVDLGCETEIAIPK
ncbi:MAG TPA: hypothetical protein VI197_11895 [Polyangiaceae bacterium]